jgi:2-polyprenyl-3-methyl-5-hydroxy-6-metoxy-1,4-benzoquinol methylase
MMDAQPKKSKGSVKCPHCEGLSAYMLSSTDVNRRTVPDVFDFYRCSACDIVFLDPRPEDLTPFYKGGYQPIPKELSGLKALAKRESYRMEPVLRHKKRGRLLEIGPWIGIFSCNAKDAGFDVTAIEMNAQCVNFLNNVLGIEAIQSCDPAAAMNAMDRKFDVIALWHSLEHLPKPWIVLQSAAQRLAPGGILLIAVPNIESYDFSVLKAGWVHLDCPRHLYFYTARSLERRCLANGLETLEITTSDQLSRILSRNAWCHRAGVSVPIKYVRAVVGSLLYRFAWRRGKGNGSGLTAIFANPN